MKLADYLHVLHSGLFILTYITLRFLSIHISRWSINPPSSSCDKISEAAKISFVKIQNKRRCFSGNADVKNHVLPQRSRTSPPWHSGRLSAPQRPLCRPCWCPASQTAPGSSSPALHPSSEPWKRPDFCISDTLSRPTQVTADLQMTGDEMRPRWGWDSGLDWRLL